MVKKPKPSLEEQLCWIGGMACWLFYFMADHNVSNWYYSISGVAGYLAIVFTSTAVWISMDSRHRPESHDNVDS